MTPSSETIETARRTLVTVGVSAAGGLVAYLLNMPGPWIMGGAISVAAAGLAGVKLAMPNWLRDIAFVLIGMSMGASVARDSLSLMVQWPVTLIALVIELFVIVLATGYMLRRVFGLDAGTAYLSSFPGHLSFIMGIASAGVGDARQIAIIQVIRILMLTVCVPIGAIFLPGEHLTPSVSAPEMSAMTLIVGALACAAAGYAFVRLRIPAGYVLGAMTIAIGAKFAGYFEGAMPAPLMVITFVLISAVIGSRFSGITRQEFRAAASGGLIATFMTVGIVTAIAFVASMLVEVPFGQIWLGLAPGALEGMGALGIALGYDPAFVIAHHVARLLLLTFAIPLVAFQVRSKPDSSAEE